MGHAVIGTHDFAQLFDVEAEQLARELTLVTHHRRSGLQIAQPGQAHATQEPGDGGAGESALARDLKAWQTQPAQGQDHGHLGGGSLPGRQ